jgi:hypothetical protein
MPAANTSDLVRVSRSEKLRLSYGQQRLWFIDRLSPQSPLYNEPLVVIDLAGQLDESAVRATIDHLVARHEALRTVIHEEAGEPSLRIIEGYATSIERHDFRYISSRETTDALQEFLNAAACQPFDLSRGPLVRFSLLHTGSDRHILVIALHHIVSDGWSVRVLLRELASVYGDAVHKRPLGTMLAPLDVQYADYAAWQRRRVLQGALRGEEIYWLARLAGAPTRINWSTTRRSALSADSRRLKASFVSGRMMSAALDRVRAMVASAAGEEGRHITRFMTLLAIWALVLHRRCGAIDLPVGTAVAGRLRERLEPLVGFFVNVLVLRVDLSSNPTFVTLVKRVRDTVLGALAHQELPFDLLVEKLRPSERGSHQPLVNVFFAYHNFHAEQHEVDGLRIQRLRFDRGDAKFDLALLAVENEEDRQSLTLQLWYDSDLFDQGSMRAALDEVCALVARLDERRVHTRLMAVDHLLDEDGSNAGHV